MSSQQSVKRSALHSPTNTPVLTDQELERFVTVIRALGHSVRLRMIDLIHCHDGDICVCEFEDHFDLKQPTISHHLKVLRDAGLIHSSQDGQEIRHRVDTDSFRRLGRLIDLFSS